MEGFSIDPLDRTPDAHGTGALGPDCRRRHEPGKTESSDNSAKTWCDGVDHVALLLFTSPLAGEVACASTRVRGDCAALLLSGTATHCACKRGTATLTRLLRSRPLPSRER